jgi:hypothetical protein
MFSDGSDRRVAEYLAANVGVHFCFACQTEELGITHDQVRRASWRLKDTRGCSIRPSRCARCHRRRITMDVAPAAAAAIASPAASVTTTDTLASYLRAHPGYSFCVHCLARDSRTPVGLMREAMWALERSEAFPTRTAQCVNCLLTKRVIRYETPSGDDDIPRRVIEFMTKSVGQAFCPSCVAFATDIALADVKRLVLALEPVVEFTRHEALCSACGRWLRLIGSGHHGDDPEQRVSGS